MSVDPKLVVGLENPPTESKFGARERLRSRSHPKHVQEKLLRFEAHVTVLKLTQVGEASSLRRSGEFWLRNSAKLPRNFGIRGATARWSQQSSAGDCLLKTQDSANS